MIPVIKHIRLCEVLPNGHKKVLQGVYSLTAYRDIKDTARRAYIQQGQNLTEICERIQLSKKNEMKWFDEFNAEIKRRSKK